MSTPFSIDKRFQIIYDIQCRDAMTNKYTSIFFALGFFLVIALFVIVRNVGERQNVTSRASASSTISFTSDIANPNVGNTVSVDVTINPGNNAVSLINLTVSYDNSKLNPLSNGFAPNTTAFPATLDGPIYNTCSGTQCTMYIALSIGSVPTNAITTTTRIATLNFQALSAGSTQLSCANGSTQVYSVSSQDQANENVLSSCTPVSITIGGSGTVTPIPTSATSPTSVPTTGAGTPTPTNANPTATLAPGTTATPTPTPSTKINLNLGLTGVGIDGGNTHPLHPLRSITFYLYNVDTNAITTVSNSVVFDGKYFVRPVIDLGQITSGNYQIFIHSPGYLTARLSQNSGTNTIEIKNGDSVQVTPNTLIVGDIAPLHDNTYGDNVLDILDYNAIISCYELKANSSSCVNKTGADLDDNGKIDAVDYNLMLRSFLQTRQGDTIPGNPNL